MHTRSLTSCSTLHMVILSADNHYSGIDKYSTHISFFKGVPKTIIR